MAKPVKLPSDQPYEDEADLLRDVKDWLDPQRRDGIMYLPIRDRYARGYSDLFICVRGQWVVAELKDNIGKPTPHQKEFIKDMIECGAIGAVCRSVKDVADLVERAKEIVDGRLGHDNRKSSGPHLRSAT